MSGEAMCGTFWSSRRVEGAEGVEGVGAWLDFASTSLSLDDVDALDNSAPFPPTLIICL